MSVHRCTPDPPTDPGEPVRHRILVTDDEAAARRGIVRALGRERYSFVEAESGLECLELLDSLDVDLLLLDLRMPGLDGRATLERLAERQSPPPVVVVTADSNLRTAVDAVRAGAADFLAKPYDIEELRWTVERTLRGGAMARENRLLRRELRRASGPGRLLGSSPAMESLRRELEKVGPTRAGVLVRGETGTGKELVARELHRLSTRASGPFVAVNCAAVPEGLLESELFGHRKGAFTGADRERTGRFREAHGGTLFLDEVGDMPAAAQAKLLRVLQERVVEPLGGGKPMAVDVRVLAATHRDLEALSAEGTFRQDLYYRLRVVELRLPPLRERDGDVLELATAFLEAAGLVSPTLDPGARTALLAHPWPGNVRELKNAMERAAIFSHADRVCLEDLPADLRGSPGAVPAPAGAAAAWPEGTDFQTAKQQVIEGFERRFLTGLLERHRGNLSAAARDAGVHRQNLQKKLRQLHLDADEFR
ncbi:MAG: sigma-54 dependent transcriptional regulator [Holophagales bacterium]|nr:sigma-54 dependent transcriptional regulator [Holophagales bacterium]